MEFCNPTFFVDIIVPQVFKNAIVLYSTGLDMWKWADVFVGCMLSVCNGHFVTLINDSFGHLRIGSISTSHFRFPINTLLHGLFRQQLHVQCWYFRVSIFVHIFCFLLQIRTDRRVVSIDTNTVSVGRSSPSVKYFRYFPKLSGVAYLHVYGTNGINLAVCQCFFVKRARVYEAMETLSNISSIIMLYAYFVNVYIIDYVYCIFTIYM